MRISDWSSDVCSSDLEARAATGATASAVFVPPRNAAAAIIESIDAGIGVMVCVTERVPVLDMVRVKRRLEGSASLLVGPNSQGIMVPGRCKIGVMPAHLERPGRVGIRSEEHTSELQSLMRISYAVFCLKKKIKH